MQTPYQMIQQMLIGKISSDVLSLLPRKWEKLGDVLIIKLSSVLEPFSNEIGEVYASVLGCKSVLVDTGGISGPYRKPVINHIFGEKKTETVHDENGIRFHLDPQEIMFSSGNIDERKRMGFIAHSDEIVIDLFAGIGYFSIPMAVYSKPQKIFACEINPLSYRFLLLNCKENKVNDIVCPILGDCKKNAPKNIADRVIMGYFHDTISFLDTAIESLKQQQGIIHYHDTFPDTAIPDTPLSQVQEACHRYNRFAYLAGYKKIKSYAPGISHYVLDIEIREKGE